jgi:hypothetical protein
MGQRPPVLSAKHRACVRPAGKSNHARAEQPRAFRGHRAGFSAFACENLALVGFPLALLKLYCIDYASEFGFVSEFHLLRPFASPAPSAIGSVDGAYTLNTFILSSVK